MKTIDEMPSQEEFDAAFAAEVTGRYRIRLSESDARAADDTSIGDGEYTATQLYKGVLELLDKGTDPAGDLARAILYTLGFEWI